MAAAAINSAAAPCIIFLGLIFSINPNPPFPPFLPPIDFEVFGFLTALVLSFVPLPVTLSFTAPLALPFNAPIFSLALSFNVSVIPVNFFPTLSKPGIHFKNDPPIPLELIHAAAKIAEITVKAVPIPGICSFNQLKAFTTNITAPIANVIGKNAIANAIPIPLITGHKFLAAIKISAHKSPKNIIISDIILPDSSCFSALSSSASISAWVILANLAFSAIILPTSLTSSPNDFATDFRWAIFSAFQSA